MSYYKVNMMGGFRVADKNQVLDEGEVYEFTAGEVSESRGLAAALRERWLIETDESGKPFAKAKPKKRAALPSRSPAEEVDMYPNDAPVDEEAELERVNAEEQSIRFEDADAAQNIANETVATPAGPVGPRKKVSAAIKSKSKRKSTKRQKNGSRTRRTER